MLEQSTNVVGPHEEEKRQDNGGDAVTYFMEIPGSKICIVLSVASDDEGSSDDGGHKIKRKLYFGLIPSEELEEKNLNIHEPILKFIDKFSDDIKEQSETILNVELEHEVFKREVDGKKEKWQLTYNGHVLDNDWLEASKRSKFWTVLTAAISIISTAATLILFNEYLQEKLILNLSAVAKFAASFSIVVGCLAFLYAIYSLIRSYTSKMKYHSIYTDLKELHERSIDGNEKIGALKDYLKKFVDDDIVNNLNDANVLHISQTLLQHMKKHLDESKFDRDKHWARMTVYAVMLIGAIFSIVSGVLVLHGLVAFSSIWILIPKLILLAAEVLVTSYNLLEHREKNIYNNDRLGATEQVKVDLQKILKEQGILREQASIGIEEEIAAHKNKKNARKFKLFDFLVLDAGGKATTALTEIIPLAVASLPEAIKSGLGIGDLVGGGFVAIAETLLFKHMYDGYKGKEELEKVPGRFKDIIDELLSLQKPGVQVDEKALVEKLIELYDIILTAEEQNVLSGSASRIQEKILPLHGYKDKSAFPKWSQRFIPDSMNFNKHDPEGKKQVLSRIMREESLGVHSMFPRASVSGSDSGQPKVPASERPDDSFSHKKGSLSAFPA